ncbi:hypothetical protein ACFWP7_31745 [Streptomyces sp. NPDC058470]|uniref:hypothetical protein n=1 Tax=Streptomyces sp. NPDC058470 TaxID=3346515 RepID=UPI00365F5B15
MSNVPSLAERKDLIRRAAERFGHREQQPHPLDERLAAQSEAAYAAHADHRIPSAASLVDVALSVRASVLGEVLLLENVLAAARERGGIEPGVIELLEDVVDGGHQHTIALAAGVRALAPNAPAGPVAA